MHVSERELADLLRDGDWLRRFVGTLVKAQDVDDVIQSAWLAALQAQTIARNLRHWLLGAAANGARLLHRKNVRGANAMRHAAACASHEPAAAELVAALEVQQIVGAALLALPEPSRTILMLRYQQRLPVEAIAAQIGLKPAAVRQRLRRGRDAVRGRLQQRYGTDWRGCIAVVAFATKSGWPAATGAAVAVSAVAVSAVAAAAVAVALLASTPNQAPTALVSGAERASAHAGTNAIPPTVPVAESFANRAERVPVALAQESARTSRAAIEVRGRVVASEDKRPLAGVVVAPNAEYGSGVPEAARAKLARSVTGADGGFAVRCSADVRELDVWFSADGRSSRIYDADPPMSVDLGDIPLHRGYQLNGRLVDEAGAPAAGVTLEITLPCALPDDRNITFYCTADVRGDFVWKERVPAGKVSLRCASEDWELLDGKIEIVAKAEPNEFGLRCRRLQAITGVAFEPDGTPCADLDIAAFDGPRDISVGVNESQVGASRTKADGSFSIHRRKGASDFVDLCGPHLLPGLDLFEPKTGVRWGASGLRLQVRPHANVELRVIDAESRAPVERFAAMATFAEGSTTVTMGGNRPTPHAQGIRPMGRLAHGTRILVWSEDPMQAQVEVVVKKSMLGRTAIDVALPRMQSFPCEIVDAAGAPVVGTFHVLDRNGTPTPQPWSDPRGGLMRSGTERDVYRLHTVVTDRDGRGMIQAPKDGRELVLVRAGERVPPWTPIQLPEPGRPLRIVVAD